MGWSRKAKIQEQPGEVQAVEVKQEDKTDEKQVEEKFDEILVVKELPVQQIRYAPLKNGKIAKLITIEEALTEMLNSEDN
jgi:hypothetical protein